jgi:hypothetical protein
MKKSKIILLSTTTVLGFAPLLIVPPLMSMHNNTKAKPSIEVVTSGCLEYGNVGSFASIIVTGHNGADLNTLIIPTNEGITFAKN